MTIKGTQEPDFQKSLGLKAEDVERIERPILAQKVSEYDQKIQAKKSIEKARNIDSANLISKNKVTTKKLNLLAIWFGVAVGGLIISTLISIALPSFLNQSTKAIQSEAKTFTSTLNKYQQAYYKENANFAGSMRQAIGYLDFSPETTYYTYNSKPYGSGKNSNAISTAVPKQTGFKSYIGGAFLVTLNNELTTLAILCESTESTTNLPAPPTLVGQSPQCASGTTPIE